MIYNFDCLEQTVKRQEIRNNQTFLMALILRLTIQNIKEVVTALDANEDLARVMEKFHALSIVALWITECLALVSFQRYFNTLKEKSLLNQV